MKTMENRKVKIKITTLSTGNPVSVIKGEGGFRSQSGKALLSLTHDDGSKTAFIITENRILLSRTADVYSFKIPITAGEKTNGITGEESTFTVLGKVAEFETDNKGGRIFVNYTLPDLSDTPTEFKVDTEFEFFKI